ncbi:hypothetical protein NDU88_000501 [Pleurodeles waltl]|uniref:Uncharacterized protein n=1 Tax=Pleurodeles waltl TaxID=8319 RepID=A0AAV7TF25_PLEWA|nr:hypothetical protein NDU88_000501 [Pleurodeles waltl]
MQREWRDPDKILLLLFMARLNLLHDMQVDLPDFIPVDSIVSSVVGRPSMGKDTMLKDPIDKKVDGSLNKVCSGAHMTLQDQSLISDIKSLYRALDESSDCSGILELIERQVKCLSDISFDVVRASALAEAACVADHRNLVLSDWKADAAQKSSVLKLLFQGSLMLGQS